MDQKLNRSTSRYPETGCATTREAHEVRKGMRAKQVAQIVGDRGEVVSRSSDIVTRRWDACAYKYTYFDVLFHQGQVIDWFLY